MSRNKAAKWDKDPTPQKKPKFSGDPKVKGAPIVWRFSHADRDGPFRWPAIYESDCLREVVERLAAVEGLNEKQLGDAGSHSIDLIKLSQEAKDRLTEIKHDDLDSLFSLRVNGKLRIFCIHHQNIMRVLWFDPDHKVCPSEKKHT